MRTHTEPIPALSLAVPEIIVSEFCGAFDDGKVIVVVDRL